MACAFDSLDGYLKRVLLLYPEVNNQKHRRGQRINAAYFKMRMVFFFMGFFCILFGGRVRAHKLKINHLALLLSAKYLLKNK